MMDLDADADTLSFLSKPLDFDRQDFKRPSL